jgi:hypothetical protein
VLPTPEPGEIPVFVTWIVLFTLATLFAARASTTTT